MIHKTLIIDSDLFHNYGFVVCGIGKTMKICDANLRENFIEDFKICWKNWGGKFSIKKGYYNRDDSYGELQFKTIDEVYEYYGGDEVVSIDGKVVSSDHMYNPNNSKLIKKR